MANKDWLSTGADGLHFCERLGDLIADKKTTALEVSRQTGIAQSAMSEYISGKTDKDGNTVYRAPDCASLIVLSRYFAVSTDYLLGLTTVKTPDANVQAIARKTGLSEGSISLLRGIAKPSEIHKSEPKYASELVSDFKDHKHDPADASTLEQDLICFEHDPKNASAPAGDYEHDPKDASALVNDLGDYAYDRKYASELVNNFIEFAFASDATLDVPFDRYCSFREQVERSNKYAQEWAKLSSSEQLQQALATSDAYNSALAVGLPSFTSEEAAILFLKIFCDSFYNYLHSKYPASEHPLHFGPKSRGD